MSDFLRAVTYKWWLKLWACSQMSVNSWNAKNKWNTGVEALENPTTPDNHISTDDTFSA